ncbi:MAG: IPT/TIG domain-containing protein, partial [Actinomycetota bacterium]
VPGTTYSYTGSLTPDGQWIKISGTLGTPPANQMDMYVPISEMWTHDDSTWKGANGYGVYRQNGPYVLVAKGGAQPSMGATAFYFTGSGAVPTSGPLTLPGWTPVNPPAGPYATDANDVYGWIYGDLVASFAMGYWGSNYGSDSSAWNTNATPPWGVGSAGKAAFAAAWTNPFPGYPLFDVYQAAVDATGTTYGSPLNDRFTPPTTTSPELAVTPPQPQSGPYTWQVELLAQQGCAQALSVSPASGPASGGQQVTITGRNFHQGATVTFGGAPAANVQVTHNPATSLDTITATTPKAPAGGPVNVRVTNAYGSKAQNIDTSVLANAYAYPASGSGGQAGGIPVPPGGVGLGAGVFKYPGAGCSIREVVRGVMQAKPARAPRVTVPSGGIMQLAVRGLPKKAEASIDIQVNGQWKYIGRVRSNAKGAAVLPRYAQTTRGQSTLIRARAGKKGMRYLRTIAGPPRDWGGRALSPVVTSYPVGTCPVHYAAARKPVAAALGKAPVAAVPLGGITVVRVRGLKRNESTGIDVKVGSSWRFIGRVKAARNGRLAMPPVAVNQRQQVVQVRLRGDRETRYVKLRAS